LAVLRVDPPQVQQLNGRPKRDGHDGQWRPRRHTFGLRAGACRPPDQVCVRRSALRQRAMLLSDARQPMQHRHKALRPMHRTRQHVVSDVTGEPGMALMRAMRAGERAPVRWARRRNERCQHDEAPMAKALHGQWRAEHLVALAQAVALYEMDHAQSAACERQSEAHRGTVAERQDHDAVLPTGRPRQRTRHRPHCDVRGSRPRIPGVDRTALEGSAAPTALTILSEIGLDMGRWPTVKHCPAWLGRCPHHRVSGGQV
jgi:hypothetical protein